METCYWRMVAESSSKEGKAVKEQHREIPFGECKYCNGKKGYSGCQFYVVRHNLRLQELIQSESKLENMWESG